MLQTQDALYQIYLKVMHAFENVPIPLEYSRPADIFLIMPPDGNRDVFHIWLDDETQTAFGRRVFWRRMFDEQRFKDRLVGARYGREERPTLRTTDHALRYDELLYHRTALLGAIPMRRSLGHDDVGEIRLCVRLRLPLGEVEVIRTNHRDERQLMEHCHAFHRWLLTMPRVR